MLVVSIIASPMQFNTVVLQSRSDFKMPKKTLIDALTARQYSIKTLVDTISYKQKCKK